MSGKTHREKLSISLILLFSDINPDTGGAVRVHVLMNFGFIDQSSTFSSAFLLTPIWCSTFFATKEEDDLVRCP